MTGFTLTTPGRFKTRDERMAEVTEIHPDRAPGYYAVGMIADDPEWQYWWPDGSRCAGMQSKRDLVEAWLDDIEVYDFSGVWPVALWP